DVVGSALPAQVDPVMYKTLALQPLADAERMQQVDGVLLEQPGSDPLLHILPAAVLEHYAFDPLACEQQRERQSGGPGADNSDLGPHGVWSAGIGFTPGPDTSLASGRSVSARAVHRQHGLTLSAATRDESRLRPARHRGPGSGPSR